MSSSDDAVTWAFVGLGGGLWMFFNGFRRLKLLRKVSALPTSKIRSVAMGAAEVAGRARIQKEQFDPIYSRPCAYYRIKVEQEQGSGKNRRWVTIHQEDSAAVPFLLQDDTGCALVLPVGAELHHPASAVKARTGFFAKADAEVSAYLNQFGSSLSSLRMTANIIREGMPVYVLGLAGTLGREDPSGSAAPLRRAAEMIKSDPQRMKALDKNNDGQVDAAEWEAGVAEAVKALPPEKRQALSDMICLCKDDEGTLVLGETEKDVLSELQGTVMLQVFGGPVLAIVSGFFLAHEFGLFR